MRQFPTICIVTSYYRKRLSYRACPHQSPAFLIFVDAGIESAWGYSKPLLIRQRDGDGYLKHIVFELVLILRGPGRVSLDELSMHPPVTDLGPSLLFVLYLFR